MNKLKLAVWILVLANAVIAYAGLNLSDVFRFIFESTIEGGMDALPLLSKNYIRHERWICAVFTVPVFIAALIVSARRAITAEDTLVFGAITLLNISLQIYLAVMALSQPFIPVISPFRG